MPTVDRLGKRSKRSKRTPIVASQPPAVESLLCTCFYELCPEPGADGASSKWKCGICFRVAGAE
jgi:hypothetical protein